MTRVSGLLTGIVEGSTNQSRTIDQVARALTEMGTVTQQNSSGAEELAAAATDLAAQSEKVEDTIQDLAQLVGGYAHGAGAAARGGSTLNVT